jgi:hypothetical protein
MNSIKSSAEGEAIMNTERELTINELDVVTGGVFDFGNIIAQANNATQVGGTPAGPPDVWVGRAWVPQWW